MVSEVLAGDPFASYARSVNPQFVRMLRAIGFDRRWARAEGAYLWDADGTASSTCSAATGCSMSGATIRVCARRSSRRSRSRRPAPCNSA